MSKTDLNIAIVGLKMGLVGITISIASTLLSLNYPLSGRIIQNIISLVLAILCLVVLWITFKIKVPKNIKTKTSRPARPFFFKKRTKN